MHKLPGAERLSAFQCYLGTGALNVEGRVAGAAIRRRDDPAVDASVLAGDHPVVHRPRDLIDPPAEQLPAKIPQRSAVLADDLEEDHWIWHSSSHPPKVNR